MKLFWTLLHRGLKWPKCAFLLAAVILAGCSSPNPILFTDSPQPPASVTGTESASPEAPSSDLTAARFHVGDTVTVDLSGTLQKIPENVQTVTEEGTVTLPYIGPVRAAGLTAGELQKEIHDAYVPKYYTELTVNVSGQQLVFYVGGEVKIPGRLVYTGGTTVTKAIQAAGDFTDYANRRKVLLIRNNGERLKVNCIKAAQDPSLDPPVYPGDQILVPRRIF
jgi:polysaccharide biosynthesis/export protein VpsN